VKKYIAAGVALAVALVASAIPSAAMAETVTTDFESFSLGSVNGQDGWHSAKSGDVPDVPALPNGYDQEVTDDVPSVFGTKALRHSNAYAEDTGEFEYQTYSKSNVDDAGEATGNSEFVGEFDFSSTSVSEQAGLNMKLSPDDGHGGRMSYLRLVDQPDGIHAVFVDTPEVDGNFVGYDAGVYSRTEAHHIKFWIKFVSGPDNDIVRLIIDGVDIGDQLGKCFTTWENYYRAKENREPPVTNSIEFRSDNAVIDPNPTTPGDDINIPSLVGGGYLFDNVVTTTANGEGPAPGNCGDKGAFCSPGYWKNAPDSAWAKVAPITKNSTFNSVVVPDFYEKAIEPSSTTLWQVLTAKSATKYGKAAGPFGLNPYNAVGAALTSKLPGYVFDPAAVGSLTDTCPLDGNGNWKPGAAPTS
jgi:hypothetical protein